MLLGNVDVNEPIRLKSRKLVTLTMGQGILADLRQMSFYSGYFSSCSPIAMYNSKTYIGGLFHFPGSALTSTDETTRKNTSARLRQMFLNIEPDRIWLNNREGYGGQTSGGLLPSFEKNDIPSIEMFLRTELAWTGRYEEIPDLTGGYSFYLDDKLAPRVQSGAPISQNMMAVEKDRNSEEQSALEERWEAMPPAIKVGIDEFSQHLPF